MPWEPTTTLPSTSTALTKKPLTGGRKARFILTWVLGLAVVAFVGAGLATTAIEHSQSTNFSARLDASTGKLADATSHLKAATAAEKPEATKALKAAEKANLAVRDTAPNPIPTSPFWIAAGVAALGFMIIRSWRPAVYADEGNPGA